MPRRAPKTSVKTRLGWGPWSWTTELSPTGAKASAKLGQAGWSAKADAKAVTLGAKAGPAATTTRVRKPG